MARKNHDSSTTAQPRFHQHAKEIQAYGTVSHALPLELEEPVRLEITEQLNQMLADTITLRDLYKNPIGRLPDRPSINCICSMTSILANKLSWWTQ